MAIFLLVCNFLSFLFLQLSLGVRSDAVYDILVAGTRLHASGRVIEARLMYLKVIF